MRGGDDVGSRMRVAAAACLVSSGLFVAGASGAVALAEPDSSGDAAGTGAAGRGSDETAGQPRRSAPRGVDTVARAGPGSPGPRPVGSPARIADFPARSADSAEGDSSKLPEAAPEAGEAPSGVAPGEHDDSAPVAEADGTGEDKDDEECGWGWWPLPPDSDSSAPNGGDGYGGGAPSTAQPPAGRPGAPPGWRYRRHANCSRNPRSCRWSPTPRNRCPDLSRRRRCRCCRCPSSCCPRRCPGWAPAAARDRERRPPAVPRGRPPRHGSRRPSAPPHRAVIPWCLRPIARGTANTSGPPECLRSSPSLFREQRASCCSPA